MLQIEFYYYLCYSPIIFLSKLLRISKNNQTQETLINQNVNNVYFLILLLSLFSFKGTFSTNISILVIFSLFLARISILLDKLDIRKIGNNSIYLILPSFALFFIFLLNVTSFLTLFFFIELYGVLYYFLFLTSYNFTNQTVLRYKNGLLLLLWNNFLTTFFLAFGCFLITRFSGSTNFFELSFLTVNHWGVYIFLFGLFWKLGLPVFHFFKLEVYKYLLKENVFLFSILTTTINVVLFYVCFTQPIIFNSIYLYNSILFGVLFAVLLAALNLKLSNFLQFLALSGVFTLTTVMSVFLI